MHQSILTAQDDFAGWRDAARLFLAADIAPDQIVWQIAGDGVPNLFAASGDIAPHASADAGLRISRDLLATLRLALRHSASDRFSRAYRLLWRMRQEPLLPHDPADPDMIAMRKMAKSVRRDMHKMHAFVRFRKVGDAAGREQFAAWFEPDHHIVRAVAGFFRDRFTAMDWLIVTPRASIGWDGKALREGPGGTQADVPQDDEMEVEWLAYYASIFNPARLKIDAMKREMPARYWRNLPEADLISSLIQGARKRVDVMVGNKQVEDLFGAAVPPTPHQRGFASLEALYSALREEDVAPSPNFSTNIVSGEGPRSAPLMFVGEQPGDREDLAGRPFVGPAGQILNSCLEEAGIARDCSFLTNAIKRFKYLPRGKQRIHQTPTAGDVAHYRWWLAEEIQLVDPRVVVALGTTALHALSGQKQALAPVRGVVSQWQGRHLLATVHPSYLLRLPDEQSRDIERGKFVRELRKAARSA